VNTRQKIKNILSDPELAALVFWNGLLIIFYEREVLRISTLIWLFYFQNIFIGIQYFLRFKNLENNLSQQENAAMIKRAGLSMTINDKPIDVTDFKIKTFFAMHFGLFHFVYAIFLTVMTFLMFPGTFVLDFFLAGILFMAVNTFISTQSHYISDIEKCKDAKFLDELFKVPYLRVFPMHFFILGGFFFIWFNTENINLHVVFFIFLLAKMVADISMHVVVNKTWQGSRPKAFGEFI
jgi:hypothetical protein